MGTSAVMEIFSVRLCVPLKMLSIIYKQTCHKSGKHHRLWWLYWILTSCECQAGTSCSFSLAFPDCETGAEKASGLSLLRTMPGRHHPVNHPHAILPRHGFWRLQGLTRYSFSFCCSVCALKEKVAGTDAWCMFRHNFTVCGDNISFLTHGWENPWRLKAIEGKVTQDLGGHTGGNTFQQRSLSTGSKLKHSTCQKATSKA